MRPSIECPACGAVSHNPNDVVHGYCALCCATTRANVAEVAATLNRILAVTDDCSPNARAFALAMAFRAACEIAGLDPPDALREVSEIVQAARGN